VKNPFSRSTQHETALPQGRSCFRIFVFFSNGFRRRLLRCGCSLLHGPLALLLVSRYQARHRVSKYGGGETCMSRPLFLIGPIANFPVDLALTRFEWRASFSSTVLAGSRLEQPSVLHMDRTGHPATHAHF